MNSSSEHHAAADRVFKYLYKYRWLRLQLNEADDFLMTTDISFANNTVDHKSSQAYIMILFREVIRWWANKQNTVTTLIIKAELLSLSQDIKKNQYIKHLLDELNVSLDK